MFAKFKRFFFFPVASYFRFFARIRLARWNPRIIVITGSSGKTTLLHLVESQLGGSAKYSHEANSSFGIPFDILDIHRRNLTLTEWPKVFLLPLFNFLKPPPKPRLYVVEADCDRPHEGAFLSGFLRPEVTLWTNVSRTHSMNFDRLVGDGVFDSVEEAIAHEFGFFAQETSSLIIAGGGSLLNRELSRAKCKKDVILENLLKGYSISLSGTRFLTDRGVFSFPYLLPREVGIMVLMTLKLLEYLDVKPDKKFSTFKLPPGRNSFFKGIKDITIVDSTYNANLDSMEAIIDMFGGITVSRKKWIVIGDMLEQGEHEEEEHKKLAKVIAGHKFDKIILMGPRVSKFTFPELKSINKEADVIRFLTPKETLVYLNEKIEGKEVILFKGARFLEGVVENLLNNRGQASELARREKIWEVRRNQWGL